MKKILKCLMYFVFAFSIHAQAENCETDCSSCYQDLKSCDDCSPILDMNYYAKILGGVNVLNQVNADRNRSTYEAGYLISGSLGATFCYGLSLEGEYSYRRNEIKKIHFFGEGVADRGHFQTSSFMANLLWDLPLSSWGCSFGNIRPFIGAGIGYDYQQMESSTSRINFKQKWDHFAWQVMAGIAYPIFCNTDITLEYKFHQGGSHFNNNSFGVGLVYKFKL